MLSTIFFTFVFCYKIFGKLVSFNFHMWKQIAIAGLLLLHLALAQPPLPPAVPTTGNDCQTKYLGGKDILVPDKFGDTNQLCPDSRGCDWQWNVSLTPCTQTLLSFHATVGASQVDFATINPSASSSLEFRCINSGSGVTMVVKPIGSAALMEWRYASTTCDQILSNLVDSPAPFGSHSVAIYLPGGDTGSAMQMWYSNSKDQPFISEQGEEDEDQGCQKMCFAGLDQQNQVTLTGWKFCYDSCKEKMQGGGMDVFVQKEGEATRTAVSMKKVQFTCTLYADQGLTRLVLHGLRGDTQVWSTWSFNAVACSDLINRLLDPIAQRVYIQHDYLLQTADGETVELFDERDLALYLGHLSTDQTISSSSSGGSSGLSSLEIALIVVVSVLCCVLLLVLAYVAFVWCTRRQIVTSSGSVQDQDEDADDVSLVQRLRKFAPTLRMAAEMIDEDEMHLQEEENEKADSIAKTMKLTSAQRRALYPDGETEKAKRVPHNAYLYMDREEFNDLKANGLVLPEPKQK